MKMQARHVVELVEAFTRRHQLVQEDMRQQITRLVEARQRDAEEIERLQSQLAKVFSEPVYDGSAHDREQSEQDAALGRLVRRMENSFLAVGDGRWVAGGIPRFVEDLPFEMKTPEEALRATGVGETES